MTHIISIEHEFFKNKNLNIQLNEEVNETENSVCIEGRHFSVLVNGENFSISSSIQQRINELHNYSSISLRQFCAKILNIEEEELPSSEFTSIATLQSLALKQIPTYKQTESSYEGSFPLFDETKTKTSKEKNIDLFENLEKKIESFYSQLEIVENKISDLKDEEPIYQKTIGMFNSLLDLFKKNKLEKEIKSHNFQKLQTLLKIHQESDVTNQKEASLEDNRLHYLLQMAILVDSIPHVNEVLKAGGKPHIYHLYMATLMNSEELIKKFVLSGLDPNTKGKDGVVNLLYICCLRGQKNAPAIKILVELGAGVSHLDLRNHEFLLVNSFHF